MVKFKTPDKKVLLSNEIFREKQLFRPQKEYLAESNNFSENPVENREAQD